MNEYLAHNWWFCCMCMLFRLAVRSIGSYFTQARALMKSKDGEGGGCVGVGKRVRNKKRERRRKVKDENVSYLLLEAVTLIYLVSSHTSAFARHFLSYLFSNPPPLLSLCLSLTLSNSLALFFRSPFVTLVSTSRYFLHFLSFIPCSLSPAKNFSCSVWCAACQACFEYTHSHTHTHTHTHTQRHILV